MTSRLPAPVPFAPRRPDVDVLVVDDRPEQRLALEAALVGVEVSVVQAGSGREALKLLLRRDFALILLDVNMPGMDGFELASLIRSRPRSAQTPIIFVTAASEVETHVSRGYSLGAVDYIHVPVVPEILRTKVSVFVELYRKTEEIRRRGEELRQLEVREHRRRLDEAMEQLAHEAREMERLRQEHFHALRAQKLSAAMLAINASRSTDEMLQTIATEARVLLDGQRALLWIRDDGQRRMARSHAPGAEPGEGSIVASSALDALLVAAAASTPLRLEGSRLDSHPQLAAELVRLPERERPRSWLSMPLSRRDGTRFGVLVVCDRTGGSFEEADESIAASLAESAAASLQDLLFREAREANRIKDEFLAVLSHELRTPLSAMMGWTQLLRGGSLDARNQDRAIEIIERNLKLQTQLIDDLLDMSRIVTGKLRLDPAALPLAPLIGGAVDALRPAATAREIELVATLETAAACIWGDAGRLEQVVGNLLSNAMKFTPNGGRIEVSLRRDGVMAELKIRDNGVGIDPELLPRIFDRFAQAKPDLSRTHGGLGLGLTIVQRLVELHGGTVRAESEGRDRGACFTVRLPVFDVERPRTGAGTGATSALRGVRILVVEDEPDAREMISVALSEAGARLVAVGSAADAMAEFERQTPDLLISDISMPGEDGCALMRKVRARPVERGGAVPAIALTALAEHRDRTATLRAGYQIHLAKPVDLGQLVLAADALAPATAGETVAPVDEAVAAPDESVA